MLKAWIEKGLLLSSLVIVRMGVKKKVTMINTLYRIITFLYCRVPSQDLVQSALLHQLLIFTMEQLLVIPAGRIRSVS